MRTWILPGALAIAVTAVLWSSHTLFPETSAGAALDTSYVQALGVALARGFQFGKDIVFTYGPLGYFTTGPYDAHLFWIKVIGWDVALGACIAGLFAWSVLRLRRPIEASVFFAMLVVPAIGFDARSFLALLAATALAIEIVGSTGRAIDRGLRWRSFGLLLAKLAPIFVLVILLALVKFTYFVFACVCIGAIDVVIAERRSWPAAFAVLAAQVALFLSIWAAIGQSPNNVWNYVSSSLALASSFSEAQAHAARPIELALAIGVLVLVSIGMWLFWRRAISFARRALAFLALFGLALAFKAGFVRAIGNQITFFDFAGVVLFFLPVSTRVAGVSPSRSRFDAVAIVRCASALACLVGIFVSTLDGPRGPVELVRNAYRRSSHNVRTLFALDVLRTTRETELAKLRVRFDAPKIRAAVGDRSVDMFSSEQGVLFLNRLDWRPRPVFQSYSVFTSELSQVNARFLESERAPEFVLFRSGTIDRRFPNMEDSASIGVLLRDYRAVEAENGYLVLRRREDAPRVAKDERRTVLETKVGFGESFELGTLDGVPHLLSLDIRASFTGRLRALLDQDAPVFIEVEDVAGLRSSFRIVPAMMKSGVLIEPWLPTHDAWMRFAMSEQVPHVARLRIVAPGDEDRFQHDIGVKLERCEALAPTSDPNVAARLKWSMFKTAPTELTTEFQSYRVVFRNRLEVLVVHAPSTLRFDVLPGHHTLHAAFGLVPEAYTDGVTDGVVFRASVATDDGGERVLWERAVDPERVAADKLLLEMSIEFDLDARSHVLLTTDPGPAEDPNRDWAFWTGIEVK